MERELERKGKEKKTVNEEEKSEEKPIIKPKPEYILSPPMPPKTEAEPKQLEEKPVVTIKPKFEPVTPKPKPEILAPKPAMSRNAERTYLYLKEHGVTTPLRIAKELNMNPLTVMKALRELERRNKVLLQNWAGGEFKQRS